MWNYEIVFKENKKGGKWGLYKVNLKGILTKSGMVSLLSKTFSNLEEIVILNYSIKMVESKKTNIAVCSPVYA